MASPSKTQPTIIEGVWHPPHHVIANKKRIELRGHALPVKSHYIKYTLDGRFRDDRIFVVTRVDKMERYCNHKALRRDVSNLYFPHVKRSLLNPSPSFQKEWFGPRNRARHYLYFKEYLALWNVHRLPLVWTLDSNMITAHYAQLVADPIAYCLSRAPPMNSVVPLSNVEAFLTEPTHVDAQRALHWYDRLLNDTIYNVDYKTSIPAHALSNDVQDYLGTRGLIVVHNQQVTAAFVHRTLQNVQVREHEREAVLTNQHPPPGQYVQLDASKQWTDVPNDVEQIVVINGSALHMDQYLSLLKHPAKLVVVGDPRCLRAARPCWGMPPLPVPEGPEATYTTICATDNLLLDIRRIYEEKQTKRTVLHCIAHADLVHRLNYMIRDVGGKLLYHTPSGQVSSVRTVRDIRKGNKLGAAPPGGVMSPIPMGYNRKVVFANQEETTHRGFRVRYAMCTNHFFGPMVKTTLLVWSSKLTQRHIQTVRNRTRGIMYVLR